MDQIKKLLDYRSIIILAIYVAVVFIGDMKTFEVMTPQWLYLSIVNLVVFGYLIYFKTELKINLKNKLSSFFFLSHIGFLLVSVISMVKSISTDESLLYISWYATFFGIILNLYFVFNKTNKLDFSVIAKLISLVLFVESFGVVYHFFSHYNEPRSTDLILEVLHNYGNRNIFASALAIKLPFVICLFAINKTIIKQIAAVVLIFGTISVFLIGAKTAVLAMILMYLLSIIAYFIIFIKENKKQSIIFPGMLILLFSFSLLLSLTTNKIYKGLNNFSDLIESKPKKSLYLDLPSGSLVDSNGRFIFWTEAFKDIKENPLLGLGSGNWKFDECDDVLLKIPNTAYMNLGQPHNDFLQHFLEEGIFGFLFYLAVFVIVLIVLIKKLKKLKSQNSKFVLVIISLALMTYTIDALLNFPHERPTIQVFFALFLVLALTYRGEDNEIIEETNDSSEVLLNSKIIIVVFLSLGVFTFIINYKMFESATMQYKIVSDTTKKDAFSGKYSMNYDTFIRRMPEFPDAMILGESIEHTKALYAISDEKIDIGLKHLDKSILKFPNAYVSKGLKAMVYHNTKDYDSSLYYAKEVFEKIPSTSGNATILANLYVYKKDTTNLFKVFDKHLSIVPTSAKLWKQKASCVLKYRKDVAQALRVLDSGLYYNPNNELLEKVKNSIVDAQKTVEVQKSQMSKEELQVKETQLKAHYDKGNNFFTAKDYNSARVEYLKALEISPNNLPIVYKLGFLEKNTKNFSKSIDYFTNVIEANFTNDGRPEYSRGTSYLYLGDQANAKKDFTASRNKGYPLALKMDAAKFD